MVMRSLLGFAVVVTGVLFGLTRPQEFDGRASAMARPDESLRFDRGISAHPKSGSSARTHLLAVGVDDETPSGPNPEATQPNVRIFGRDGEPVVGFWFQAIALDGTKTAKHTDRTGGLVLTTPCQLVCGRHRWNVETEGSHIHAEQLVPLDIEILTPRGTSVPVASRAAARDYVRGGRGQGPIPSHVVWGRTDLRIDVELPEGLARIGTEVHERFVLSRFAERARLAIPAWPETDLRVHIRELDGRPSVGAKVYSISIAGKGLNPKTIPAADAAGAITIKGVPLLRHEQLALHVSHNLRAGRVSVPVARRMQLDVQLNDEIDMSIGLGGGAGGGRRGRSGRRRVLLGRQVEPATLVLSVQHSSGAPARGMAVRFSGKSGLTDRYGQVRFEKVRPGRYLLFVFEPGFVTIRKNIWLTNGETKHVTMREPVGATKIVHVQDHEGVPVPFARVTVHGGTRYVRIQAGVQDLVLWTDLNGEIELPRLSRGNDHVMAVFGSRGNRIKLPGGREAVLGLPEPHGMR